MLNEISIETGKYTYMAIESALGYDFGKFLMIGIFVLVVFALFIGSFKVRKSKAYRQEIADMFVAGKIRQIAKKEDVDLELEEDRFKKWSKKRKREHREYGLDDVVEEELNEKIEDSISKESKSSKKDKNKGGQQ